MINVTFDNASINCNFRTMNSNMYFFSIILTFLVSCFSCGKSTCNSLLFIECKNLILMKIVPSHRSSAACEFLMHWMWMRVKRFRHEIFWKIGFKFYLVIHTKQIFVNVSKFYSAIHRPFKPISLCILKGLVKSIINPIVKSYKG